jgi:glutamate-1-semialdehyde aminotransferase
MRDKNVHEYLFRQGSRLMDGVNQLIMDLEVPGVQCKGFPPRSIVTFDASCGDPLLQKSYVQQELIRHGILWSGFHTMSFSHSDTDIDYTLEAYREVLPELKSARKNGVLKSVLRGDPVEPVFRRTTNFHTKARPL